MDVNEEIRQSAEKLSLTLDTPESVRQQIKQITLAQKQLRAVKKKLSANVRSINQQAVQSSADSLGSVVFDILGKRKVAGSLRADKRRAIQRSKQNARQPYLNLQAVIDELILEGDRLKILADEYLLDPEGVKARVESEEERQRQEEEERRRLEEERKRQQEEMLSALLQIPKAIFQSGWQFLDAPLNNNQWLKKQAANLTQHGRFESQSDAFRFLKSWAKFLLALTGILLGLLLLSTFNVFFAYLLFLCLLILFVLSPMALIVGLIRPSLVIPVGSPTRIKAAITYGLATVLFLVLVGLSTSLVPHQTVNQASIPSTSPSNYESPTPTITQNDRSATVDTQPSPPVTPSPSISPSSSPISQPTTSTADAILSASDTNAQINLRATPSVSSKLLGYGVAGDRVQVIQQAASADGDRKTWYQVQFPNSGAVGWIREDFMRLTTNQIPSESPTTSEPPTTSESPTPSIGSPIRNPVSGSCQCPYDTDKRGRQCGGKSAYSRPGGARPACYVGES